MFYARNIRLIRKLLGYTQEEFIQKLGLTRGKLQTYEQGRTEPPIDLLVFLQNETNIPIYDILTRELSEKEIIAKNPMPVQDKKTGYGLSGITLGGVQEKPPEYRVGTGRDLYDFDTLVMEVKRLREELESLKNRLK